MSSQATLFEAASAALIQPASYRLDQLEVYNWGPFCGLHRIAFDATATAIIGPTGSGKTTLVDGLMTLLVEHPRYNLASTGGNESDRDLVSYVRGVLGGDGSDGREEVLRGGSTMTGLCATYVQGNHDGPSGSGQGHQSGAKGVVTSSTTAPNSLTNSPTLDDPLTLRIAALLWIEGTGSSAADLKRRWIFSTAAGQTLEHWLRIRHEDGLRDLMRLGRETAGLRIVESKRQYLARTRKFFDVGDNAFTLLNRAAGLKQLNSVDEIFRELVLDDRSAFARALEVAAEFDNLAAIREELETARRQRDSLVPVREEERKRQKLARTTDRLKSLKHIVPTYFAMLGCQLWERELERLGDAKADSEKRLDAEISAEHACQQRVDDLKEAYLQLGGGIVAQLEETISKQNIEVNRVQKFANDYRNLLATFDLKAEFTPSAFQAAGQELEKKRQQLSILREQQQAKTLAAMAKVESLREGLVEIEQDSQKVKNRPGSNIPPKYQDFRSELAAHLGLGEIDLPYLAEMVEVKADQAAWRGAIERAIGSERLRVLVAKDVLGDALRWINSRHNRVHVRLQAANDDHHPRALFPDSYAHKLNFKSHRLQSTARRLIASRDYHCVDTVQELETTEHGLTMEGTMSHKAGRFEKMDNRRIDQDWMTGFDNRDQLAELMNRYRQSKSQLDELESEAKLCRGRLNEFDQQLTALDQLQSLDFEAIDLPTAEAELKRLTDKLSELLDPDSDASQAKAKFDSENAKLRKLREIVTERRGEIRVYESELGKATSKRDESTERLGKGLTDDQRELAEKNLKLPEEISAARLDHHERHYTVEVDKQLSLHLEKVADQEKRLIRQMEAAKRHDTGELADVGSELDDVQSYLERLTVLQNEALPQKQRRFLEYLNRSSDQGVTQLLAGIQEEVDAIETRIGDLNRTLLKVDFRAGRYLQLQPQRLQDERKRAMDTALRNMRSAALKDDAGESHYKALRVMVDILREAANNRRQVGSRALLDPRYRLKFYVVEVDRETGKHSPPRTGSQSGSGGEKELMASHILTASLSYALCPTEATRPLHSSVVLDEAFSKSSPSAATRIIEALNVFGLHPIFVTPNKEIGLLKRHTRKVICVHRVGGQSSVASIRWEQLDEFADSRAEKGK